MERGWFRKRVKTTPPPLHDGSNGKLWVLVVIVIMIMMTVMMIPQWIQVSRWMERFCSFFGALM
jgi:hypothetical protein